LRDYLRRNGIGILHTHGYRSDLIGYLATRGTPTSIVTTHHGWIRNSRRQRLMVRMALTLSRAFDGVEVVSNRLREELPASLKTGDRVRVVHNAIVLADYVPAGAGEEVRRALGVPPDCCLLAAVGRMSPEKGCVEMLEAFEQVARASPRAQLVFVGEGPLQPEMARRASERGLGSRVHFAGHQERVQPFYEAADVVVSPSRTEGLSNVLLEALAFRLPVVATKVGGNAEIVDDRVSGLLVRPGDPGALAEAIIEILADRELRDRLARNGYARVVEEFAFEGRMRKEELFYEHVLGRREKDTPVVAGARNDWA
jgi:glycosyltransferase involved in cell wall biosynthesis